MIENIKKLIRDEDMNGYKASIAKGIYAVRQFNRGFSFSEGSLKENITSLKNAISEADAVMLGAGAGMSTAAGFVYDGARFERYFFDFEEKYGLKEMYSGGFIHILKRKYFGLTGQDISM